MRVGSAELAGVEDELLALLLGGESDRADVLKPHQFQEPRLRSLNADHSRLQLVDSYLVEVQLVLNNHVLVHQKKQPVSCDYRFVGLEVVLLSCFALPSPDCHLVEERGLQSFNIRRPYYLLLSSCEEGCKLFRLHLYRCIVHRIDYINSPEECFLHALDQGFHLFDDQAHIPGVLRILVDTVIQIVPQGVQNFHLLLRYFLQQLLELTNESNPFLGLPKHYVGQGVYLLQRKNPFQIFIHESSIVDVLPLRHLNDVFAQICE